MFPYPPSRNLLALAGGAGSGKTTLAESLAAAHPRSSLLHLDHYVHTEPERAPLAPGILGTGEVIDFSDPRSIDWGRVHRAIGEALAEELLVVEGTFALEKQIRRRARRSLLMAPSPRLQRRAASGWARSRWVSTTSEVSRSWMKHASQGGSSSARASVSLAKASTRAAAA
ncbi:hypothetical protein ACFV6B_03520 [Streptomyces microflavus]|uniref:hypothetical protein n=1 Tax=Streptomyces microflavus TaxID=1919 RepID=UPI0036645218